MIVRITTCALENLIGGGSFVHILFLVTHPKVRAPTPRRRCTHPEVTTPTLR